MSRLFDGSQTGADETYLSSPASAAYNNLGGALTISMWVKPTAFNSFSTLIVQDPVTLYQNFMGLQDDGTIYAFFGGYSTTGPITSAGVALGASHGSGYATNDLGTINAGNGLAHYRVFGASGGVVTGVQLKPGDDSGPEDGYSVANNVATTPTTGVGDGTLTVNITQISPSAAVAITTTAVPLDEWSNIVATWDASGDGKPHIYINGVEASYATHTGSDGLSPVSAEGFWIGNDGFDEGLVGELAEVAIFNTALTSVEAAAIAASTSGVPGSPVAYWHLCGTTLPEPDFSGNGNDMVASANPPVEGAVSPGFDCAFFGPSTYGSVGVGSYGGESLAEAFHNPQQMDILQVVSEGGDVIWNLSADGTATNNPTNPTVKALLGRFEGASFAEAFYNPYQKNILQIIGQGDAVVFWIDYTGQAGS